MRHMRQNKETKWRGRTVIRTCKEKLALPSVSWPRQVDSISRYRTPIPVTLDHLHQPHDSGPVKRILTIFTTMLHQASSWANRERQSRQLVPINWFTFSCAVCNIESSSIKTSGGLTHWKIEKKKKNSSKLQVLPLCNAWPVPRVSVKCNLEAYLEILSTTKRNRQQAKGVAEHLIASLLREQRNSAEGYGYG